MANATEEMCKINEDRRATIQDLFTEFIKPSAVLDTFRKMLTKLEYEEVQNIINNKGDILAAHHLLNILYQKKDWFPSLLEILCDRNVRLQHVSYMMKEENEMLEHLQSMSTEEKRTAVSGKSVSSLYIDCNNVLEHKIHEIFVEFVEPNDVLRAFHKYSYKVLTQNDIEHVSAELNIHGSHAGNCLLLKRLILYENWFDVLLQVLRDPEIKLDHAADEMEKTTDDTRKMYQEHIANVQQICVQHISESIATDSAEMRHESEVLSHDHQSADNRMSKNDSNLPAKTEDSIEMDDNTWNTELIDATAVGNIKLLMSFYLQESDMDKSDKNGRTALMYAALQGQHKCIKLLALCDCAVNKKDCYGNTALMWACSEGHTECVKVLVNEHADVNVVNKSGVTPLVLTAKKGYVDCMRLLLEAKCDPDIFYNSSLTALMYAARFGHSDCVKLLIDWHCNVNMGNHNGQTALMYAADNGNLTCMELLINGGAGVDKSDNEGNTAIMFAVRHQHIQCIQLLINKGCNLNIINNYKCTPLRFAKRMKYPDCVKLLREAVWQTI